ARARWHAATAKYRSIRCARTERTGAGGATSHRSFHILHSQCRCAELSGPRRVGRSSVLLLRRDLAGVNGQPDPEPGFRGYRLHFQVAVVPADNDPPGDIKSQAGALAYGLRREERLEDPAPNLLGYAGTCVSELREKPAAIGGRPDGQHAG